MAAVVLGTATAGCGGVATDSSLQAAQVRFVQAAPATPAADIAVNGTGAAYGLGYASFTSYLPVMPGPVSLKLTRSGGGATLATTDGTVSGGQQYTAVLSRGPEGLREHVFPDQSTPAPEGQIAFRVIDAVEGAGPLTVFVRRGGGEQAVVAMVHVDPENPSRYVTLPAASYTVTATVTEGALSFPLSDAIVKADAGGVRTIVFTGSSEPARHGIGFVLDDADAPEPLRP